MEAKCVYQEFDLRQRKPVARGRRPSRRRAEPSRAAPLRRHSRPV